MRREERAFSRVGRSGGVMLVYVRCVGGKELGGVGEWVKVSPPSVWFPGREMI